MDIKKIAITNTTTYAPIEPPPAGVRLPDQWRQACNSEVPTKKRLCETRPAYELILNLAAEGGGVELYGKPARDGSWTFWSDMSDWTPTLEDEDASHRTTNDVPTWNAAIAVLDGGSAGTDGLGRAGCGVCERDRYRAHLVGRHAEHTAELGQIQRAGGVRVAAVIGLGVDRESA